MTTRVTIEYANHPVRISTYDSETGIQIDVITLTQGRQEVYVHGSQGLNIEEIYDVSASN